MNTVLRAVATVMASIQTAVRSKPASTAPKTDGRSVGARKGLEDEIRMQMHLLLVCVPPAVSCRLLRRIQLADLEGLWYLRSDLVATLASARGEAHARAQVATLDARFKRGGAFLRLAA